MTSNLHNAEILIQNLEKDFSEHMCSLFDISRDTSSQLEFIEMEFNAVHFDKIPYKWREDKESSNTLSVDTILYDASTQVLYLVEFKSGWPKASKEGRELRFKAYESLGKLIKYWTLSLGKSKQEFFELKIKYCVITRAESKQNIDNVRFIDALNVSQNYFNLKNLDGTFLEQTRIFVKPSDIFQFLSRVTGVKKMKYHHKDGTCDDHVN